MAHPVSLTRRALLGGAAAGAGWLLARGLGGGALGGNATTPPPADLLRALAASLTPRQRELIVLPADDPSRQITNTIAVLERPHLGTLLSPSQRALVQQLYASMLSEPGREAFAATLAVEGRLDGCVLAIYGEPERGAAHAVIMGGHLMLRTAGEAADGAPFGGGCAYGQQVGNGRWRVAGNAFAAHGDAANRFTAALAPEERARALLPTPPHELLLQVQGAGGRFPGVRIGSALRAGAARRRSGCSTPCWPRTPTRSGACARACIDANGGRRRAPLRLLRGPRLLLGHGELCLALPPPSASGAASPTGRCGGSRAPAQSSTSRAIHTSTPTCRWCATPRARTSASALGELAAPLADAPLRELLEGALRRATGEELAFFAEEIPGRFCAGPITTGLAYALDPYGNHVSVATIAGRAMAAPLRDRLAARGAAIDPAATLPGRDARLLRRPERLVRRGDARRAGEPRCSATRSWRTSAPAPAAAS